MWMYVIYINVSQYYCGFICVFLILVFNDVWVSTDDNEIAAAADLAGAKIFHRSVETASDDATSLSAVKEFSMYHKKVDIFAVIQCTSPFLTAEHLAKAYKMAVYQKFESVFSVTRSHKLRWKLDSSTILFLIVLKQDFYTIN